MALPPQAPQAAPPPLVPLQFRPHAAPGELFVPWLRFDGPQGTTRLTTPAPRTCPARAH